MRIALLVASAFLLSLSAPAQAVCPKDCTVVVTMAAGCGSGIKVAPDPLFVAPGKDPVDIEFVFQGEGWAFADDGIAIHLAGSEFPKGPGSSKSRKFKHKNNGPKVFKYDVNLIDARPGPTQGQRCSLDPTIIDQ